MAKQNLSQIVDLVERFKTVPYSPRNSEKSAFSVHPKFPPPSHPIFIIFQWLIRLYPTLSRLKSIVKVVEKRLHPNFQPKRTQKAIFLVTSKIVIREQETLCLPGTEALCLPGTETLWNNHTLWNRPVGSRMHDFFDLGGCICSP